MFKFAAWRQLQGVQRAGDCRQKERIRRSQQNYGQDCVKNQEVGGQLEIKRDRPGQEARSQ